jgi:hypothetical protein
MNPNLIFWPLVAQVVLTIVMYFVLAARKANAIKAGRADRRATALDNKAWPADVVQVSNNIANQTEAPVLFYVVVLATHATDSVSVASLAAATVFSVSRYAHAYVHITSNYVPMRLRFFIVGVIALIVMVVLLAVNLALKG